MGRRSAAIRTVGGSGVKMTLTVEAPANCDVESASGITVSGGQKEFIKTTSDSGMLVAVEAHKIVANTDHEQTGGTCLRISPRGDVRPVDASVTKYARANQSGNLGTISTCPWSLAETSWSAGSS